MDQLTTPRRRTRIRAALAAIGILLVAVTAVAAAAPARSSGPPSDSPEAERVCEVERTRLHALVEANMAVAGPLHADDFQLIPPPGVALSREEYLGAVAAGAIDYLTFEPISEIEVRLYGRAAFVTYQSHIDIVVSGLGRFEHDTWHTYLYEKRQGHWQVVWEQATAIGGFPPA
ncbi:MAG: nuclear transport factor 2 family protein [Gaiellaceae bacterium MAG52_C11]|nr:nuclear transport factor 2 family protein [Candidatus Gaiellasilicea maunaloa]